MSRSRHILSILSVLGAAAAGMASLPASAQTRADIDPVDIPMRTPTEPSGPADGAAVCVDNRRGCYPTFWEALRRTGEGTTIVLPMSGMPAASSTPSSGGRGNRGSSSRSRRGSSSTDVTTLSGPVTIRDKQSLTICGGDTSVSPPACDYGEGGGGRAVVRSNGHLSCFLIVGSGSVSLQNIEIIQARDIASPCVYIDGPSVDMTNVLIKAESNDRANAIYLVKGELVASDLSVTGGRSALETESGAEFIELQGGTLQGQRTAIIHGSQAPLEIYGTRFVDHSTGIEVNGGTIEIEGVDFIGGLAVDIDFGGNEQWDSKIYASRFFGARGAAPGEFNQAIRADNAGDMKIIGSCFNRENAVSPGPHPANGRGNFFWNNEDWGPFRGANSRCDAISGFFGKKRKQRDCRDYLENCLYDTEAASDDPGDE